MSKALLIASDACDSSTRQLPFGTQIKSFGNVARLEKASHEVTRVLSQNQ